MVMESKPKSSEVDTFSGITSSGSARMSSPGSVMSTWGGRSGRARIGWRAALARDGRPRVSAMTMEYSESEETLSSPCQRLDPAAFKATTRPLVSRNSAWPRGTLPVSSNSTRVPRKAVIGGEDWRSSGRPE